jgi:hypothetical protein
MTFKKLTIAAVVAAFVAPTIAVANSQTDDLQNQINRLQREVNHLNMHHKKNHALRKVAVTTTPLLARQSAYNATDLISNFSGINEDLTLLQNRNKVEGAMGAKHAAKPRSWVQLSGYVNAVGQYSEKDHLGGNTHSTNLNITAAELQTIANISPWVSGFVSLKWNSFDGTNNVAAQRAYMTLGKLSTSPFYASVGTMYVPFGRYSTALIEDPVTKVMGRNLSTHGAALIGFAKPSVSAQIFGFKGDALVKGKSDDIIGADANYYATYKNGKAQIGAGFINNLSESIGIQSYSYQNNGNYGFNGFNMAKRVPAYDINAQASFGAFALTGEFIGTTTDYDTADLSFNSKGARPKALHIEGLYNFKLMNRPSNVGLFYGHTSQALGFALPNNSFGAIFNTEVAKDLLLAAEYDHNVDYKATDKAAAGVSHSATPLPFNGTGKSQNIFDVQLAAYF